MLNTNFTNERIQIISDAKIQEFLKLFIICEYLFKTFVRISDSKIKEVKIHMHVVNKVFDHYGFHRKDQLLRIYGGTGTNSYKTLRDKIVHHISRKSYQYIINNFIEITSDMNEFIYQFTSNASHK